MGRRLLGAFAIEDPERFAQLLGGARDAGEVTEILHLVPEGHEAGVLTHLKPEAADRLLASLPEETLATWLGSAPEDVGRRLLSRLGAERSQRLIERVKDPGKRRGLRRLAGWPAGTIGSRLHVTHFPVSDAASVDEVRALYRAQQGHGLGPAIVLDAGDRVLGLLDLAAIVANEDPAALASEFCLPVQPVHADSPLDSLRQREAWQGRDTLPVVDFQERLVGFIGRSDVAEALGGERPASLLVESAVELSSRYLQFLAFILTLAVARRREP